MEWEEQTVTEPAVIEKTKKEQKMKDFVSAALPFVLTGIALAILAANHSAKDRQKEKKGARMAMGAGFGLLMGSLLNSCGLWENHALGLVFGPLWGMALASLHKSEDVPEK